MPGVFSALRIGAAVLDGEGKIIGCCQRFAFMAGRPASALLGVLGRELIHPDDRAAGRWLLTRMVDEQEGYTVVARPATAAGPLYECHVVKMAALNHMTLCLARPFLFRRGRAPVAPKLAESRATYAADMAKQMARLTAEASLPVTSDLFIAAALMAEDEGGLEEVAETPA